MIARFAPCRHITEKKDQEAVHSMRCKTGKKAFMAVKVDFEKAYDRLSWSFIHDSNMEARLPICMWNWHCLESSSMKLLWNGAELEEFKPFI